MEKNTPRPPRPLRGYSRPFYTHFCALCDATLPTGKMTRSLGNATAHERGWRRSRSHRWLCPECAQQPPPSPKSE